MDIEETFAVITPMTINPNPGDGGDHNDPQTGPNSAGDAHRHHPQGVVFETVGSSRVLPNAPRHRGRFVPTDSKKRPVRGHQAARLSPGAPAAYHGASSRTTQRWSEKPLKPVRNASE